MSSSCQPPKAVRVPPGVVPADVLELCRRLRNHGHRAWIVGGCLRDVLLERQPSDWDVATSARPEEVMTIFRRVIPTGVDHGTVTVRLRGRSYEVTTLRGEGAYTDSRRPDEVFFVEEVEHDLARRDFTINAIAYDPLDDVLADPFDGVGDLERKRLHTVGDPHERFNEDGLRVLRAARFVATLEFELDPHTERAIPSALQAYTRVSHERVREEWLKTLRATRPSRAFEVMRRTGILAHTCPRMLDTVDCDQGARYRRDVWGHTMGCLDEAPEGTVIRMAALLHGIGKPATRRWSEAAQDYVFEGHAELGAELSERWLRDYRFSRQEQARITHLVRHHVIERPDAWSDSDVRRFVARVGRDCVPDLLSLARADAVAAGTEAEARIAALERLATRIRHVALQAPLSTRDLAVTGKDLMHELGLRPGRHIGELLEALLDRVLDEPSLNERETLLELARQHRLSNDG